ncbi:methyltransferase-like protein [Zalerion maritima]|uniref:Methyltransferase-like protein n=1 Tax=Zalerion maritima TaxID=339359 RepID=A0AAD5WS27_9PEZI|nr:methyltransferase-like protein [Zalerion maritima]
MEPVTVAATPVEHPKYRDVEDPCPGLQACCPRGNHPSYASTHRGSMMESREQTRNGPDQQFWSNTINDSDTTVLSLPPFTSLLRYQRRRQMAKEYDAKHGKTLEELMKHVRSLKDFIGSNWASEDDEAASKKEVRLLDYACGTGMVSRTCTSPATKGGNMGATIIKQPKSLGPWITSAVGIDITENMVEMYNTRADNQGLSESEMHAFVGNLCSPKDPSPAAFSDPKFFDFDVAGVGLGFHHFDDPGFAAKQLTGRLKPGGTLFIIDFLPHDELTHNHPSKDTVTQHGFSEEQIRKIFEDAGCGEDFGLKEVGKGVIFENMHGSGQSVTRHVFLARGTKA